MSFDRALFEVINQHWTNPALDWWSALVRATGVWLVPTLAFIVLVAWRGSARARSACALCVLVFIIGDAVFVRTLKIAFQRPRPMAVLNDVRSVRLADAKPRILALAKPLDIRVLATPLPNQKPRSFPSGHAWNAFAVATLLTIGFRRWGWLAFAPAAAIAFARVHAGVHWPTDVIASAIAAPPCTLALGRAIERAWLRLAPARWRERLPGILKTQAK